MKDVIKKEQQFKHNINAMWNAISKAEEISKWFIQAEFKAEPGYKYVFTHENTNIIGEVKIVNPVNELAYTWEVKGTGVETLVRWQLEENEEGTLLKLEHSGISKYPGESAVAMFDNFDSGWVNCISELDKYLT